MYRYTHYKLKAHVKIKIEIMTVTDTVKVDDRTIYLIRRKRSKSGVIFPQTEYILEDEKIISAMKQSQNIHLSRAILEFKKIDSSLSEETILKLYHKSISVRQSSVQGNGSFLEKEVEKSLMVNNITINKGGIIVGFNKKKGKCDHVLDIVVGVDVSIGRSITDFVLLSCITTFRERWRQDDWTLTFQPLKYILTTTSDDYPLSFRFQESEKRMIITSHHKRIDDRIYQLNFSNLYCIVKTI